MDKKNLSESDICDKFIRPAMEQAGWHGMDQIYREFPLRAGTLFNLKRPTAWDEVNDWIDRHGSIANADVVRIRTSKFRRLLGANIGRLVEYGEHKTATCKNAQR